MRNRLDLTAPYFIMAGPGDKFAPSTVLTHILNVTNAEGLREKHPSSLLAISHQRTKHIKRRLYDSTSLISSINDCLWSAKNPVRPLLHLKCSWLKRRVSKHCISHVPPCLVSGCASCMTHNDKWPSDPFLFCRLYYIPAMVKMIPKRNGVPGGVDSVDSRISMDHGVSTTIYWTTPVHICSTWNPLRNPPITSKISPDEPIPKDSRTWQEWRSDIINV